MLFHAEQAGAGVEYDSIASLTRRMQQGLFGFSQDAFGCIHRALALEWHAATKTGHIGGVNNFVASLAKQAVGRVDQ